LNLELRILTSELSSVLALHTATTPFVTCHSANCARNYLLPYPASSANPCQLINASLLQISPPWPPLHSSGRSLSGTCDGHPTRSPLCSTRSSSVCSDRLSWQLYRQFVKDLATAEDQTSLSHIQVSTNHAIAAKELLPRYFSGQSCQGDAL
jgi:hypothetical protein